MKGWKGKADKSRGGKTTLGSGQAWSSPSPGGQWRKENMEETGCEIICGAPATRVVKGQVKMKLKNAGSSFEMHAEKASYTTAAK